MNLTATIRFKKVTQNLLFLAWSEQSLITLTTRALFTHFVIIYFVYKNKIRQTQLLTPWVFRSPPSEPVYRFMFIKCVCQMQLCFCAYSHYRYSHILMIAFYSPSSHNISLFFSSAFGVISPKITTFSSSSTSKDRPLNKHQNSFLLQSPASAHVDRNIKLLMSVSQFIQLSRLFTFLKLVT